MELKRYCTVTGNVSHPWSLVPLVRLTVCFERNGSLQFPRTHLQRLVKCLDQVTTGRQLFLMQGIELTNPLLQAQQEDAQRSGTESYFSEYSGFRSIKGK